MYVVRGEKVESGSGGVYESAEADHIMTVVSNLPGFGEKVASDNLGDKDVESCVETGSYHSAFSDDRHDLDYLANNKGKPFLEVK